MTLVVRVLGIVALALGLVGVAGMAGGTPTKSARPTCPTEPLARADRATVTLTCRATFYTEGRASSVDYIVVHTIQGSLQSGIHTIAHGSREVSAHYLVGRDGTVVQMVREADTAWHAGTCPIGSDPAECEWPPSRVLNANSVGIEHAGHTGDPDYPTEAMYRASAELVRHLAAAYDVPLDRQHIVGHGELKPTKPDPGPPWDWDYYMRLVRGEPEPRAPSVPTALWISILGLFVAAAAVSIALRL